MKCEKAIAQFADYLAAELDPVERRELDKHLADCPACGAELRSLSETWTRLGVLPEERPSAGLRTRFYDMLEAYREGQRDEEAASRRRSNPLRVLVGLWPRRPAFQAAAALLLMVAGLAAGYGLSRPGARGSVAELRREVRDMRQTLAVSLLNQSSPFERLQGVSLSREIAAPDRTVLQTLFRTLDEDPSVNVRLAAVDALYLFYDRPGVRNKVLDSLAGQDSPLVQAALIDLLVGLRERRAVDSLRLLLEEKNLNPQVKQRAESGLRQLTT